MDRVAALRNGSGDGDKVENEEIHKIESLEKLLHRTSDSIAY